jgi:two-component system sensor histidine kinase BaeS
MKVSLTYKFFLNLLAAVSVVAIGMFFFMQYSFDRGFLNYVNTVESERFEALAADLEEAYAEHGGWEFLRANFRLWGDFMDGTLPEDARPRRRRPFAGPGRPGPRKRPPPKISPPPTRLFEHRVVLMDVDRMTLFGPPDHPPHMTLMTLAYNGKAVGYLGLIPQQHLTDDLQLRFVAEQKQTFAIIALVMACLAALLALPLARQMVTRLKTLAGATHQLAAGRYGTRLDAGTADELDQLMHDFNTLANTLEQNEQLRRQWVGDISHELRTPLAVLRGEIEALQDNVRPLTPATLASLHSEAMRLERLVNDLFQLALSDMGALTYRKEDLDLALLLEETMESFRQEFAEKEIAVTIDVSPAEEVVLFGDAGRLQQLFDNLLANSLKYTDPGGQLDVRLQADDDTATILWQDSVPGVSPEEINKLFDRLYRVENSRSRETGGAGLGLAICRNIVEAHEGDITAEPSKMGGVLIKVRLPLSDPTGGKK